MTTNDIKKLVMIVEMNDGKLRQLIIKKDNYQTLFRAIQAIEGEILLTEKEVGGIEFL